MLLRGTNTSWRDPLHTMDSLTVKQKIPNRKGPARGWAFILQSKNAGRWFVVDDVVPRWRIPGAFVIFHCSCDLCEVFAFL